MSERKEWQAVEYEIVSKMWLAKKNDKEIAVILARTESSVKNVRLRMGLADEKFNFRFWTDKDDEELRAAFNRGLSDQEMADRFDRSIASIECRRSHLGLFRAFQSKDPEPPRGLLTTEKLLKMRPLRAENRDSSYRHYTNTAFMIELLRAGHKPGAGELHIAPEGKGARFFPTPAARCYLGSPAAMCVG